MTEVLGLSKFHVTPRLQTHVPDSAKHLLCDGADELHVVCDYTSLDNPDIPISSLMYEVLRYLTARLIEHMVFRWISSCGSDQHLDEFLERVYDLQPILFGVIASGFGWGPNLPLHLLS